MKSITKKEDGNFTQHQPDFPLSAYALGASFFDGLCLRLALWCLSSCGATASAAENLQQEPTINGFMEKIGKFSYFIQNVSMFCFMNIQHLQTSSKRPEVQRRYVSHYDVLTTEIYPTWNSNICFNHVSCKDLESSNWNNHFTNCLFQVQIYKSKIAFMDSNWSFSTQRKNPSCFIHVSFNVRCTGCTCRTCFWLRLLDLRLVKPTWQKWSLLRFFFLPGLFFFFFLQGHLNRDIFGTWDVEMSEPPGRISFVQCSFYDVKILVFSPKTSTLWRKSWWWMVY